MSKILSCKTAISEQENDYTIVCRLRQQVQVLIHSLNSSKSFCRGKQLARLNKKLHRNSLTPCIPARPPIETMPVLDYLTTKKYYYPVTKKNIT